MVRHLERVKLRVAENNLIALENQVKLIKKEKDELAEKLDVVSDELKENK